ncbi:MAG TPA: hypothetical protein VGF37_08425, partial [Chthoniobacterales bacterium]
FVQVPACIVIIGLAAGPVQRNAPGRNRLAVFPPADSLDPYQSRYGRFTAGPARTTLKKASRPAATPLYARPGTSARSRTPGINLVLGVPGKSGLVYFAC